MAVNTSFAMVLDGSISYPATLKIGRISAKVMLWSMMSRSVVLLPAEFKDVARKLIPVMSVETMVTL